MPDVCKQAKVEPEQDLLTCGDCQREFLLSDIVMFIQHKVSRCNKENVQPLDSCHQDEDDDDEDDDPDPYKTRSSSVGGGGGGGGGDGTGERGDVMNSMLATIISSHRTSISAPINRKDEPPTSTAEESHNASLVAAESSEVRDREGATEDDSEDKTQGKLSEKQHSDNNELDDDDDDAVKIVENGINGDSGAEISEHSSGKQKDDDSAKSLAKNKEPSIFTCGTCKSVYSSSWFLVQHVQKTHGLKIYEEPRDSSPPPSSTPSSIPARPIVVQPDKLLAEQLRGGKDSSSPAPLSPFHSSKPAGRASHRSPTCSPRGSSGGDMYSFPTPYMPGAPRQPAAAWPYGRPPMGSEFAAMMHPEIMMDQLRRLHGMVSAADHHAAIPGMPFLRPPQMDSSSQYSHSERLRLLAATGGNTSPKHIPPPPPPPSHSSSSNSRKQSEFTSPPTQSTPPSAFTTPTSSSSSTLLHDGGGGSGSGGTTPSTGRQHKQCEFCNKQFRFTSNLVLHRRLHTGEKPYSCPLCSFTSAQATKLRSHMRSHVTAPTATSSPQEHKLSDSDIEDSEEFVQREADAEAAIRQLQKDARKQKEQENNDVVDGEEATDLSALNADDMDRASLLSEVMMKTGLSSLPNYKEAFTAALAEVPSHNKSPQRHASSPKPEEGEKTEEKTEKVSGAEDSPVKEEPVEISERDESIHEMTDGDVEEENDESMADDESHSSQRRSPQSHASSEYSNCTAEPAEKRIKRETSPALSTSSPSSTFPGADQLFTRAAMEAGLYPGIWFPPTSTTASGLPFPPFMPRSSAAGDHHHPLLSTGASRLAENGLSPASSAFSNSGSPKLPSPEPMLTAGVKRRNDTCEFCGKIFKNCSNLTVHRRSHTGEKPYKCQLCPYACAQSSKLTRHMRTHGRHGKDVYRCKFCCMPFSVPSTLEKHMRKCVENQQRAAAAAAAARGHLASPLHVPASTV